MLHVFYRISDTGYHKEKPPYINNEQCLRNFVKVFDKDINCTIIADNISELTLSMIEEVFPNATVKPVNVGHGAGTFNIALDIALKLQNNQDIVYFLENDYIHRPSAQQILLEGFDLNPSFVTLYDHPDKYMDPAHGGNPFCAGGAEYTKVYLTKSCHWKITNSTTMTFASRVQTLKETQSTIRKWTQQSHPHDFQMFLDLREQNHHLISSIPGYATHGETKWLAPLFEWESHV